MAMTKSFEKSTKVCVPPPLGLDMMPQRQRKKQTRFRKGGAKLALASKGSKNHDRGLCRPCLKIHTPEGCPQGADCNFCHCPHDRESLEQAVLHSTMLRAKKQENATQDAAAMVPSGTFRPPPGLTLQNMQDLSAGSGRDERFALPLAKQNPFFAICSDYSCSTTHGQPRLTPSTFLSFQSDLSSSTVYQEGILHELGSKGALDERMLQNKMTTDTPRAEAVPVREFDCSGALRAYDVLMLHKLGSLRV